MVSSAEVAPELAAHHTQAATKHGIKDFLDVEAATHKTAIRQAAAE